MRGMTSNFQRNALARLRDLYKDEPKQAEERLEKMSGFNAEELDEVKSVFRYFDKDKNKYLDKEECKCMLRHQVGCHLEDTAFKKVFDKMDLNEDGRISFPEYLSHLSARKRKLPLNYQLHDIFELFDTNEDGRMNLDNFRSALLYMGEDAGRPDLRTLFVRHDLDKDGLISKYEFEDAMRENFSR